MARGKPIEQTVNDYLSSLQLLDVEVDNYPLLLRSVERDLSQYNLTALHYRMVGRGLQQLESLRPKDAYRLLELPLRSVEQQRREMILEESRLIRICREILPDNLLLAIEN